ncbi:MAG TPA: glycoside hydrolase family 5 protein, partial [Fimbriimonas sp.]|nr:glycoside hydrolase family 5 protein [Fimbriimonas sp.]
AFFQEMAKKYGKKPHVMYEIFNEPVGNVSWPNVVKPYSERVIKAIREIDPDNLILVGSPHWSQDVDVAAADPIQAKNIAYTLHFYAATHKQELRNKALAAMQKGVALMVTEYGTCRADGNGGVDEASAAEWMAFMKTHQLSHLNWSVADKAEAASIMVPDAGAKGGWTDDKLTQSGKIVREYIRNWKKKS